MSKFVSVTKPGAEAVTLQADVPWVVTECGCCKTEWESPQEKARQELIKKTK